MASITKYVSASGDDGYWQLTDDTTPTTSFGSGNTSILAGYYTDAQSDHYIWGSYFRIDNLGIPAGSTINSAVLKVPVNTIEGSGATIEVALFDNDDPSAPTTYSQSKNATLTTAQTTYQSEDFSTTAVYDIASALSEVVSRGGFGSSSAIVVDVRSEYDGINDPPSRQGGAGYFAVRFETFDSGNPAWVEIDYTPPNTAPEITVTPSVSYGSLTRLGPNNTPATVTFTATDAEETGTDELTWEIRTAASGGGTLVASGTCTSGIAENVNIAYNASGISEGSNTLYLRVGDGSLWSDDESFTVLMDATAPSISGISVSPNPVTEE